MAIDLLKAKERKTAVLDLKKSKGIDNQKAQVVLVLDYSISMGKLYADGTVQDTVERILPLGLAFDDNGEVDSYLFDNHYIELPENVTLKNVDGYINNKVIGKYKMGYTSYAPVLKAILKKFKKTSGGFLGFGGKDEIMEQPVYIIFITDGENDDHSETEQIVREMSELGFFIQFVGIGSESFRFLTKLDDLRGRKIDNANFFKCPNISRTTDDELYSLLMAEFPDWTKKARNLNLIK